MKRSLVLGVMCLFGASALITGGCKPKVGASCKVETQEVCISDKQALVCHDGKWDEMTCRGPAGCPKGAATACDQTVAEDNDVCNLVNDYVCSSDKKSMLECAKNRWSFVQSCLGERGCTIEQKRVNCDNSIANVGDACRDNDDPACSRDKKNALVCRNEKFVLASHCKGKNACRVTGDKSVGFKVECDDSIAVLGNPCDKENHFTCAPDQKQILKCVNNKFVADDKCKKQETCGVRGELVGCY